MKIKEFFKKYATVSNIVKVWTVGITRDKVDKGKHEKKTEEE